MSTYKVNYSELVTALQDHKQGASNELLKQLIPNLKKYLVVVMNASSDDAEEAVHRAFVNTYEKIMQDEINNKKYIYKYLLRACRNEYVRLSKYQVRFAITPNDSFETTNTPARQIENLLDKDRQRILKSCLEKLPEESRQFIKYVLKHPEATTRSLSEFFDISEANARVKKSRIISDLSHCVQKKWDK